MTATAIAALLLVASSAAFLWPESWSLKLPSLPALKGKQPANAADFLALKVAKQKQIDVLFAEIAELDRQAMELAAVKRGEADALEGVSK